MVDAKTDRFPDVFTALSFLERHQAFRYKGISHFHECYERQDIKVDPATGIPSDDESKNTESRIQIRCGVWLHPDKLQCPSEEQANGMCSPEYQLTCNAPAFEGAIRKLANLVLQYYGDIKRES